LKIDDETYRDSAPRVRGLHAEFRVSMPQLSP